MPDEIYARPQLAQLYDGVVGEAREDLRAYLALADELGAKEILDVGCGTGTLAALLAERGYTVVGVDPAEASLAIARAKNGNVTWLHGDATTLPALDADLALMTGNVAQVFLTDEDWARTVRGIHGALRPGGHFVFETRRPEYRAWEEWDGELVTLDGVTRRCDVTEVRLPFVSFRNTFRFPDGETVTSDSTLRFRDRDEVTASLQGFRVVEVREAPDRPGREFVFVAERMP
jgi:SAM-dependent methyltransferase